jgi:hypothetical protein
MCIWVGFQRCKIVFYICIKRMDLHKYVINNYFDNNYYENIDTVKQILKIYFTYLTEEQDNTYEYQFVKYRD